MGKQDIVREIETQQNKTKNVVYSTINTSIDKTTGQILKTDSETKVRIDCEPDFIKVYYKAMLAVNGIEKLPLDFVLALASAIPYCNEKQPMYFYNNRTTRKNIAELCLKNDGSPISDNMVSRYIKTAKDVSLLFETDNKGVYEVNPFMIAKGQWKNISKLQANFDFTGHKWERSMEVNVDEDRKEPYSD